nr:uncharacterized protein LOC111511758 [Leptinotarsa decemlineata]
MGPSKRKKNNNRQNSPFGFSEMEKNEMVNLNERPSSENLEGKNLLLDKEPIPDVTLNVNQQLMNKTLLRRIVNECNTPFFYHKFMIQNIENSTRNHILKTIFDFVYPATFKAIYFELTSMGAYFLARNCQEVILKIASEKFEIPNPNCPGSPFKVSILCNYILTEEVPIPDCTENIMKVLHKRYKKKKQTLDLSAFCDDEDLEDYYPLFQTKFLLFLMNLIAEVNPKHVLLQHNNIRDIENLHPLKDSLEILDLSNNELEDIGALQILCEFKNLKSLKLNGNPICDKYNSYNYVIDVKSFCPNLQKLDDVDITTPVFQKNYWCSPEAEDLASQFLEHFITVYDSDNRQDLEDLYLENSIFSVNSRVVPGQKNSSLIKLDHYGFKKPFLVIGVKDIMKTFRKLPKSEHDPYPLVCDVISYTDSSAAIVVTGIFRETTQILSFSRHFVFRRNGDEFRISNDLLHVSNAMDHQIGWSFKFPTHIGNASSPLPYFQIQYRELEEAVHRITQMNYEYSERYLYDCQYDLKKTLNFFSQLHLRGEIPEQAFSKERTRSLELKRGDSFFSDRIRIKTLEVHNKLNLRTVWEVLDSERVQNCVDIAHCKDHTIKRVPVIVDNPNLASESNQSAGPLNPSESKKKARKAKYRALKLKAQMVSNYSKDSYLKLKNKAESGAKTMSKSFRTKDDSNPLVKLSEKLERYKSIAAQKVEELKRKSGEEPPLKVTKFEEPRVGLSLEERARYKALALEKAEKLRQEARKYEPKKVVLTPEEIAKYEDMALKKAEDLRLKYGPKDDSSNTHGNSFNSHMNFLQPVTNAFPVQNQLMQLPHIMPQQHFVPPGYGMEPMYPIQPGYPIRPGHFMGPGYTMHTSHLVSPGHPIPSGYLMHQEARQLSPIMMPQLQPKSSMSSMNVMEAPVRVGSPKMNTSSPKLKVPQEKSTGVEKKSSKWDVKSSFNSSKKIHPKSNVPQEESTGVEKKSSKWDVKSNLSSSFNSSKKTHPKPTNTKVESTSTGSTNKSIVPDAREEYGPICVNLFCSLHCYVISHIVMATNCFSIYFNTLTCNKIQTRITQNRYGDLMVQTNFFASQLYKIQYPSTIYKLFMKI